MGWVLAAVLFTATPVTQANASDSLIEGAKLCTKYLPRYEREYGIPTHLLAAIATTESGRYHKGLKISIPWPWTINAEGKGYYFTSKQEAITAAKKMRARGVKSMDVGCMQVNLHHHSDAFTSLEQAFEPQNNIAYAANFLRNLYQEGKSWKKAAADYHSKTPSRGKQYVGSVYNSWYQIVGKLRAAKLQAASPTTTTVAAAKEAPKAVKTAAVSKPSKKATEYKAPRMKVIELSKKNSKDNVIIVRPEIKVVNTPTTVTVSKVRPASLTVVEPAQTTQVALMPKTAVGKKSGPTFVFND